MSIQSAWAIVIVDALAAAGVELAVVSPGSRSTPLAAAIARASFPCEVIIDERAAGFFALGRARASGRPVALVCTSGSAPAHYAPAVIEASEAGVPLVIVSANRPPELHGCGASQTIDQTRLYGAFARAFVDLGAPHADGLAACRRKVAQAVAAARGPRPGPVQIDVPLRKPLEPAELDPALQQQVDALHNEPLVAPAPHLRADDDAIAALARALDGADRPLILCGAMAPAARAMRDALHDLAVAAGAVIAAEATSQLRFGPRPASVAACDAIDLVLASGRAPAPDLIVQLGAEPCAQAWAPWLAKTRAPRWVIAAAAYQDADSSAQGVILGDPADTLARLAAALAPSARDRPRAWRDAWRAADAAAWRAVDHAIAGEPAAIRAAIAAAPPHAQLAIGNSLPVRVIDQCVPGAGAPRTVLAQRGASGIDGLIAGAAGAASTGRPTLLVLGDVSFAHDAGALAIARTSKAPLAIVVVDNGGGRIFDQLPLTAAHLPAGAFDAMWRTPPALDPVAIARAFGARAIRADDAPSIGVAVADALERPGATVIHAPVAPESALTFRRAVIAALDPRGE